MPEDKNRTPPLTDYVKTKIAQGKPYGNGEQTHAIVEDSYLDEALAGLLETYTETLAAFDDVQIVHIDRTAGSDDMAEVKKVIDVMREAMGDSPMTDDEFDQLVNRVFPDK